MLLTDPFNFGVSRSRVKVTGDEGRFGGVVEASF